MWNRTMASLLILLIGCGEVDADDASTFTEIRDDVLIPSCGFGACHDGGSGGLTLSEDDVGAIYDALVDAPSSVLPDETLVIPGDPDNSYLVKKLEGAVDIDGDPMPPPYGIEDARVEDIRAWILAGAPDD